MPAILDVAIGVVFVFLLFSLVVSALNEVILSYLDKRAEFLKQGISELFRDSGATKPAGKTFISVDNFLQHGLITVLSRGKYRAGDSAAPPDPKASATAGVPSYIPGKSFVLALVSLVTEGKDPKALGDLRPTIEALGNHELKETLLSLYDDARGSLDHFKANIENWFNESMDRVGGWYKRYAQQWLLGLSLLLAIFCNVDSIRIISALSNDKTLRETMVEQAKAYANSTPVDPAAPPAGEPAEKIKKFKEAMDTLGGTGLPIGWSSAVSTPLFAAKGWPEAVLAWLSAIIGWGVTGLAASLGAPFWFDLLNRFMDIRGVGRAPEESDTTASKKPSTGVESYVITGDSLASAAGGAAGNAAAHPGTGLTPQAQGPIPTPAAALPK